MEASNPPKSGKQMLLESWIASRPVSQLLLL